MTTRLSSRLPAAQSADSQTLPSAVSPSPCSTKTRPGAPSSFLARAMPQPAASPWPRLPVATLTSFMRAVGWPSSTLSMRRSPASSSLGIRPASASAAQRMGAACPLERTNSSSWPMTAKNKTLTISAADRQVVGWPEPAAVVMRREWILSLSAIFRNGSLGAMRPPSGVRSLRGHFRISRAGCKGRPPSRGRAPPAG